MDMNVYIIDHTQSNVVECYITLDSEKCQDQAASRILTRNSSGDEIANVNFLYDDIVHALKIQ